MSDFVHTHVHSDFSVLDGMGRIDDLVTEAERQEAPALALTDHGTMSGVIKFYERAKKSTVKPIIGCELYVADRPLSEPGDKTAKNYHLVLLAENLTGYRNLIALSTAGYLDGFYRNPRVDRELLAKHNEGLICLSGCASSELSHHILRSGVHTESEQAIADTIEFYRDVFAGRYYLEIQDHGLDFDEQLIGATTLLARDYGLPLAASNDAHYITSAQAPIHEILLCVQTRDVLSNPKRLHYGTQEFYLKSAAEMQALFGDFPEALSNTREIADRCNLTLELGRPNLPEYVTPHGISSIEYLRTLTSEALSRRYPGDDGAARERAAYEIGIIESTGFADYFLLVYDVIRFAKERGIAVGPGRGSGAGSIVAYTLGVTGVDPLAHGLSFERFLNPERISMPDMDLDFADDRRGEVVEYVRRKYGDDHVSGIITFGTIGVRAGVRDVARALEMDLGRADYLAKLVPPMAKSVQAATFESNELAAELSRRKDAQKIFGIVSELTGVARHASKHAAGVVISREPLSEHVPLAKNKGEIVTQYDMGSIDALGLLKMDFLGLRTLSVIDLTLRLIERYGGKKITAEDIPLDDKAIYDLLTTGENFGVFQVDSPGMRDLTRRLRPTKFGHVAAVVALYRPGPMQYIDDFVARRHRREEVEYAHPVMREVLADTYGIIVYQEQVMEIAVKLCGYTMGEADLLRKAMGKKKPEVMRAEKANFIQKAVANGCEHDIAARVFDDIEPFAGYAFNKSHATCYAVLTCQTAWLKAHYPQAFMAALLSCESGNLDKVREAVKECRRLGVKLFPADVNASEVGFLPEADGIRFGLASLPNIGEASCREIVAGRASGPYASLVDFCLRLSGGVSNKRVIESLAKCKAFDSLIERKTLAENLERVLTYTSNIRKHQDAGQQSLWDGSVEVEFTTSEPVSIAPRERVTFYVSDESSYFGQEQWGALRQVLRQHPGNSNVTVVDKDGRRDLPVRIAYCTKLEEQLGRLAHPEDRNDGPGACKPVSPVDRAGNGSRAQC